MSNLDSLDSLEWLYLCTFLVMLMQVGFLCLESGLTRSKHSINVAMKNLADFCLAIAIYWVFGFSLMFGASHQGWVGELEFFPEMLNQPKYQSVFLYEAMFCSTAATIVSGAIAERTRFIAYLLITLIVAALIYPVVGHWVWGGLLDNGVGWLKSMGFIDFAGASAVHSVGGWVALAAVIVVGPRLGRFPKGGPIVEIPGHHAPLAIVGGLLMFIGWFGFNGGSLFAFNDQIAGILMNTLIAAAFGALVALALGFWIQRYVGVLIPLSGMLAGLVSITASAHLVSAPEAALIGAIAGGVFVAARNILLRYEIDDVVMAIPVHLAAGVWGTLAAAVFVDTDKLPLKLTLWEQLWVQLMGICVIAFWSFGIAFIILKLVNRVLPIRVSANQEYQGLNYSEHRERTEWLELLENMETNLAKHEPSARVPAEPYTEIGQIANQFNRLMDWLERNLMESKRILQGMADGVLKVSAFGEIQSINPAACRLFGIRSPAAINIQLATLMTDANGNQCLPQAKAEFDALCTSPSRYEGISLTGHSLTLQITASKHFDERGLSYTLLIHPETRVVQEDNKTTEYPPGMNDVQTNKPMEMRLENEGLQANYRKNIYLANLSRKLREPLNQMLGYGQILQMEKQLDAKQREHLDRIEQAGHQILILIDDLHYLDEQQTMNKQLQSSTFDLNWLLRQLDEQYANLCAEQGIDWSFVGGSSKPDLLYGDPIKLQQILHRLLNNALEATTVGNISLTVEAFDNQRVFSIRDSGHGMPTELINKLQNRALREETLPLGEVEVGLGMVYHYLSLMAGEMKIRSKQHQGTDIVVQLSFLPASEQQRLLRQVLESKQSVSAWVLDQQESHRYLVGGMLRVLGLNVWSSHKLTDALSMPGATPPDIILVSESLACIDNGHLLHQVKSMWPPPQPVIIMLQCPGDLASSEALPVAVDGKLQWPITAAHLVTCLEDTLKLQFVTLK